MFFLFMIILCKVRLGKGLEVTHKATNKGRQGGDMVKSTRSVHSFTSTNNGAARYYSKYNFKYPSVCSSIRVVSRNKIFSARFKDKWLIFRVQIPQ